MATLSLQGVHYTYPKSEVEVVTDWNETFEEGTITALTGESGCGKSTRLFLAALLLSPTSGSIHFEGNRVDNLSDAGRAHLRAHNFGFIFQDSALDHTRTVLDNVLESCLYRGERKATLAPYARELLKRMNVTIPLERRPGQISGGQAQRIAVCRALVGRPRVVFADEPTGNLDAESSKAVIDMLKETAEEGASIVLVTHDLNIAQSADRHITIPLPALPESKANE